MLSFNILKQLSYTSLKLTCAMGSDVHLIFRLKRRGCAVLIKNLLYYKRYLSDLIRI